MSSPEQTCECGHPTLMHSRSLTRSLLGRCLIDGCPCTKFTPTPTNAEGEDAISIAAAAVRAMDREPMPSADGLHEGRYQECPVCQPDLTTRLATVEAERDEAKARIRKLEDQRQRDARNRNQLRRYVKRDGEMCVYLRSRLDEAIRERDALERALYAACRDGWSDPEGAKRSYMVEAIAPLTPQTKEG